MSIPELINFCTIRNPLMLMEQNLSWRNGVLGRVPNLSLIYANQNSAVPGTSDNMLLRKWLLTPNGSNRRMLALSISMFWNKYHIRPHYRLPGPHQHFQPTSVLKGWHYMAQRPYLIPLVTGKLKMFPLSYLDIPPLFLLLTKYPFQILCPLQANELSRNLIGNHSPRPPSLPRPKQSLSIQLPLCSDPWPSCFLHPIIRIWSYRAWRVGHMVLPSPSRGYLAQDPSKRPSAHTFRL